MNIVSTGDENSIHPFIKSIRLPDAQSHKGQNGKVLVIGGSSLFHGAILWAAEAVSHFADMTHVASTEENNEVMQKIKTMWQGGMVVPQKDILLYAEEDDVILVGNGMMRSGPEGIFTKETVHFLITRFPDKQFVFDAGALQMMEVKWLTQLKKRAVVTPHAKEFFLLFGEDIHSLSIDKKAEAAMRMARENNCIILLKTVDDIVTDGERAIVIKGGNAGLTKGGTGDILAGMTAGFLTLSDPLSAAVLASFILKKTAERLCAMKGYWYNTADILTEFPQELSSLVKKQGGLLG